MQNPELRWRGVMATNAGRWWWLALAGPMLVGGCGESARPVNAPPVLKLQQVTTDKDVPVEIRERGGALGQGDRRGDREGDAGARLQRDPHGDVPGHRRDRGREQRGDRDGE